jgi:hypothetical protein
VIQSLCLPSLLWVVVALGKLLRHHYDSIHGKQFAQHRRYVASLIYPHSGCALRIGRWCQYRRKLNLVVWDTFVRHFDENSELLAQMWQMLCSMAQTVSC